jgi:CubicO group peptidase (beta-lactamase class C family)
MTPSVPSFLRALVVLTIAASAVGAQGGQPDPGTLDSIAAAPVLQNRVVGPVAAVVKGDDTLLMKAYGKADLEWDVPMHVDAMFEVGSIAKQFAAAAILQLHDAKKLSLDDDITKWLPVTIDVGDTTITLRRMLSHTSGINHWQEDPPELKRIAWSPRVPRDSVYRFIKLTPLQYPIGDAQAYNNSAFWLLGLVVEKASGMKYEEYLKTQIFEPLGMTRSMYCDHGANVPRRAHGYHRFPTGIQRAVVLPYSLVFAPGAVCSTAGDLVTWLKALHGGKVLSPESYAEMTTQAKLNDGTAVMYGMGIKVGETYRGLEYIGHGGTAPGFRADAAWYPDARMAVVVLVNTSPTNLSPGSVGLALAERILPLPRATLKYYTGDASELVGRYRHVMGGNRELGTIEVTQTPNGLAFSIMGSRPETLPWAGGLKFYAQEDVTLTFRRANGDRGPVTELRRDDMGNHYVLKKQ